jgi:hypothetical protein
MARFMRAIQLLSLPKLDGPDKPGHDGQEFREHGSASPSARSAMKGRCPQQRE